MGMAWILLYICFTCFATTLASPALTASERGAQTGIAWLRAAARARDHRRTRLGSDEEHMTTILTVVGVGVSLAALQVSLFRMLNARIGGVEQRIGGVEQRIGGVEQRIGGVEREVSNLRERMAKLEGAVEGFMAGQRVTAGPAG